MDTGRKDRREAEKAQLAANRTRGALALAWLLAAALLAAALASMLKPAREYSDTENRRLQTMPAFSVQALADGSWFSDLQSALSDQFVFRDRWIGIHYRLQKLLGRREINGVYLCQDHYLMEVPAAPERETLERTLTAMEGFAARHEGLRMNALIVPNASAVLKNLLPANAPAYDQVPQLTRIRDRLLAAGMSAPELLQALRLHTSEQLYYRTDHHWTSTGAYYAFEESREALGIGEAAKNYAVYPIATDFEGTLSAKAGAHEVTDAVYVYSPQGVKNDYYVEYNGQAATRSCSVYVSESLQNKDKYTVFFGGNHPLVTIQTTANNGKVLLIFKDSYANCFVQFLTPYYERIVMLDPRYYYDDAEALMEREGVTDVLFLYNFDTFSADTSLADALSVYED